METKTIQVFVTDDGKEFYSEDDAKIHECKESLWNELHQVSDAGHGAHNLDDIVDYLVSNYNFEPKV